MLHGPDGSQLQFATAVQYMAGPHVAHMCMMCSASNSSYSRSWMVTRYLLISSRMVTCDLICWSHWKFFLDWLLKLDDVWGLTPTLWNEQRFHIWSGDQQRWRMCSVYIMLLHLALINENQFRLKVKAGLTWLCTDRGEFEQKAEQWAYWISPNYSGLLCRPQLISQTSQFEMKQKYTVQIDVYKHDGVYAKSISVETCGSSVGEIESRLRRRGWIGTLVDGKDKETILAEKAILHGGSTCKMVLVEPGKLLPILSKVHHQEDKAFHSTVHTVL